MVVFARFAGALRNSVGHDAVGADDREQSCEETEDSRETADHALRRKRVVDLDFDGAHGVDGEERRNPFPGDATIWPAEGI